MLEAFDAGIVTIGAGGDNPRNVLCSPLSGVEKGEYFDVSPYAKAASDFLINLIDKIKLPRKLKVGFSNSQRILYMLHIEIWALLQRQTVNLIYIRQVAWA